MNRKRLSLQMIGSALVLLLLVSCATPPAMPTSTPIPPASSSIPVSPAPTSAPVAVAPTRTPLPLPISPEFPTGTFFHKHPTTYCVWQFNEDGTWAFYWKVLSTDVSKRTPFGRGTYTVDGNLYTDTTTDWPDCPWPVTYNWTFDGQTLAFQVVGEDKCADRQQTYEAPLLWTKLESTD
jgi:hypothetical protein